MLTRPKKTGPLRPVGTLPRVPLIAELLARRVRTDGSAPLVTYYDTDAGVRTELSATSLANWVAKTTNLLADELLVSPGDPVELAVAEHDPGHWMTLVWALACWQSGAVVTLGEPETAAVVVCGPAYVGVEHGQAELVVCSLHPLGLGLDGTVPSGVVDYALEVRAQPDVAGIAAVGPGDPAWRDHGRALDQAGLLAGAAGPGTRALVRPGDPWTTVHDAVVRPLRDGGSSVVLRGTADAGRVRQVVEAERADTVLGG